MSSGVSSTGIRLVGAPELSAGANALAGICIGNCFLHFGQPTFTMPGLSGRYILKGWRHSGLGHVTFNIGLSVSDIVVVGFRDWVVIWLFVICGNVSGEVDHVVHVCVIGQGMVYIIVLGQVFG